MLVDSSSMLAAIAVAAEQPNSAPAEKMRLFGQFVGAWAVAITYYHEDGTTCRIEGDWRFQWMLDGRAIHDVWVAPRRSGEALDLDACTDHGATLRFYDTKIDAWRAIPLDSATGAAEPLFAREADGCIVVDGATPAGVAARWVFSEVTAQSFRWQALESGDGWQTQRRVQEITARRTV